MKGILADNNVIGQVAYLVQLMQAEPWSDFWNELGLTLRRFDEVGLAPTASDVEIWYDAFRFGIQMDPKIPMTAQQRAYTSPIWYTPGK